LALSDRNQLLCLNRNVHRYFGDFARGCLLLELIGLLNIAATNRICTRIKAALNTIDMEIWFLNHDGLFEMNALVDSPAAINATPCFGKRDLYHSAPPVGAAERHAVCASYGSRIANASAYSPFDHFRVILAAKLRHFRRLR
jgi:hypothetical protein